MVASAGGRRSAAADAERPPGRLALVLACRTSLVRLRRFRNRGAEPAGRRPYAAHSVRPAGPGRRGPHRHPAALRRQRADPARHPQQPPSPDARARLRSRSRLGASLQRRLQDTRRRRPRRGLRVRPPGGSVGQPRAREDRMGAARERFRRDPHPCRRERRDAPWPSAGRSGLRRCAAGIPESRPRARRGPNGSTGFHRSNREAGAPPRCADPADARPAGRRRQRAIGEPGRGVAAAPRGRHRPPGSGWRFRSASGSGTTPCRCRPSRAGGGIGATRCPAG